MKLTKEIVENFALEGEFESAVPYGDGHINDTYLLTNRIGKATKKYVLQRLNKNVFRDSSAVMENIVAVTDFLKSNMIKQGADVDRELLNIIKTKDGKSHFTDSEGYAWRALNYVADSISYTNPTDKNQIYGAAYAFGKFQKMLQGFRVSEVKETIPDFHNTPKRVEALIKAAEKDEFLRLSEVKSEYDFATARKEFCEILENLKGSEKLPIKVTHNDTKLNNVLFDSKTDTPLCVVDLDTIMPGLSANDFGDLVRSSTSSAAEDEPDTSKVNFDLELYELCVKGFLEGASGTLTEEEISALPIGAIMMTLECGIRFLTDYLSGDVYFKTSKQKQNLYRARSQFKLVEGMEEKYAKMCEIVNKHSQKGD